MSIVVEEAPLGETQVTENQGVTIEQETQEDFIQGQKNQFLAAAIQQLPENQKSALLLSYYQGLTNKQTAQILSISVEALESLLVRTRKKLQQTLDGVML